MSKKRYGAGEYVYARRMIIAGKIVFTGAAVFVAAAFAAAVYAYSWQHD